MKFFLILGVVVAAVCPVLADAPLSPPTPAATFTPPAVSGVTSDAARELLPYGVATLSVCNNRVSPGNAAEMATQMLLGTPVQILGRERGYYQVRTPDGYVSWTDSAALSLMDEQAFGRWQRAEKVVVSAEFCHSYLAASTASPRVSDLVQGDILQRLGKRKGFFEVAYPDGRIAYLEAKNAADYAQWAAQKNPSAEKVIAVAKTMMGVPYLWGGTSLRGVDCSGLTKTSFFLNGIIIPRDASQQAVVGVPVDIAEAGATNEAGATTASAVSLEKCLKNLLPGDLLFFGSARAGVETPRVNHTAIYLGGGEFIQAAGLVRINSLIPGAANYSDSGRRRLLSARRFLSAIGTPEITRLDQHAWYRAPR